METIESLGISIGKLIASRGNLCKGSRKYTQLFYALILQRYFMKPNQIFTLEEISGMPRGDIEKLHTSACGFGASLSKFCNEMPQFKYLGVLIDHFLPQFQLMCFQNAEILPLLDLPHMKVSRAKLFTLAGLNDIQTIAGLDPNDLVKKVGKINKSQAKDIIQAGKLIIKERLNSLTEEVDILLDKFKI